MIDMLLDAPYWLVGALALTGIGLLLSGLRRRQEKMSRGGIGLLAAAALLLVFHIAVPTPQKKVQQQTRDLMEAIGRDDWETAGRLLRHAHLMDWPEEGTDLARRGRERAQFYGLTGVKVNTLETRREPNVIVVTVSITTYDKGIYVDSVPSVWDLEYQKRLEGWVLTHIVMVKVGWGQNTVTPQEVMRR
jgi:hypothetical protein